MVRLARMFATKRRALVPLHTKDIPKGTLHDILKQSGLSMIFRLYYSLIVIPDSIGDPDITASILDSRPAFSGTGMTPVRSYLWVSFRQK